MDQFLAELAPQSWLLLLIAVRLSAMFVTAPIFSARVISVRVRAGLVVILSLITLPGVAAQGAAPPADAISFVLLAGKEAVIGAAFGLVAQFLFAGIQTAGSFIDINAGFAISRTIDPTSGLNLSILGRFYNLIAISAFLAIGGHQWLVAGIVQSFTLAPPAETANLGVVASGVLEHGDDILLVALMIGAPIMAALLVTDVVLGLISRSVPQMNVFIVGLPLKIVVALAATALLLPTFVGFVNGASSDMLADLSRIVEAAGG